MLLVEPNDAPNLRSSCSGEDVVQPVGGLGRRGVPRLKLYGFHRSSGSDSGSPISAACSNASMVQLLDDEEDGPPQYLAPEVTPCTDLHWSRLAVFLCACWYSSNFTSMVVQQPMFTQLWSRARN